MLRCAGCNRRYKSDKRQRNPILNNGPNPSCPKCSGSTRKAGYSVKYMTRGFICASCKYHFRVPLVTYLPPEGVDEVADDAAMLAVSVGNELLAHGVFPAPPNGIPRRELVKRFSATLAGAIYDARIGNTLDCDVEAIALASYTRSLVSMGIQPSPQLSSSFVRHFGPIAARLGPLQPVFIFDREAASGAPSSAPTTGAVSITSPLCI